LNYVSSDTKKSNLDIAVDLATAALMGGHHSINAQRGIEMGEYIYNIKIALDMINSGKPPQVAAKRGGFVGVD